MKPNGRIVFYTLTVRCEGGSHETKAYDTRDDLIRAIHQYLDMEATDISVRIGKAQYFGVLPAVPSEAI